MAETRPKKFTDKARQKLSGAQSISIADLLGNGGDVSTSIQRDVQEYKRIDVQTSKGTEPADALIRENFRLPHQLAETLREYAHQNRTKKTAVVIEALTEFFENRNFSSS